ncbi:hypothetical protein BDY21DRAFT_414745 [Lineolata rhizophorae]|uniref:Tyrosinase copper-binding domain-containing protein n=1 Tax=Lineolata rhizophorae TaxID=578093 RepID=A0A6A6P320_9PEZI|nr:hypothetical protein BDY21DRAFT_414745 [Lineolata rhizophorae]
MDSTLASTIAEQYLLGWKVDILAAKGLLNLAADVMFHGFPSDQCNLEDVAVRKEWSRLSKAERREYIDAVLCMQELPSKSDPEQFPGARNRYDDFVGIHIALTLEIHGTANFLTWHRYFTWAYEKALRDECGYTGYQPYMNWGRYADNLLDSPVFDGSDTSMSGDGEYVEHDSVGIPSNDQPLILLPPQNGGGCIMSGPFVNWTVNLGPVSPSLTYVSANPQADGLGYNPRCISRDISPYVAQHWNKDEDTADLIKNYNDIESFQDHMQGDGFTNGFLGVHTGGHFMNGGDPGGDLFASPGDPYFFLHHAMIDRVFWTWQNQDPRHRTNVVGGHITLNNSPPSAEGTLDDPLDIGVNGDTITIGDAASTIGGTPFCYIYA